MALSGKAIATLVIFILSIIFVIYPVSFRVKLPYLGRRRVHINLTTAPIIAILVLWASQCLGARQIRDGIVGTDGVQPYNILILFFSLAYMAITLDITGVLRAAAFWVSNKGGSNGYKLYLYFYIMLTVLSMFLGNDPVILSGTVFLVYYTEAAELEPIAWLIAEFASANTASMVLFVGNPTNVVICEGFRVNNAAFTAYTILPFLACIVFCFVALAIQFRNQKYIPKRLPEHDDLDVRSALVDPIGAWVGSLLLGSCLVVIIIVSFFHVDVWKISLPFAVAKFIWDLAYDVYRYRKNIPTGMLQGSTSHEDLGTMQDELMKKQLRKHVHFTEGTSTGHDPTAGHAETRVNSRKDTDGRLVGGVAPKDKSSSTPELVDDSSGSKTTSQEEVATTQVQAPVLTAEPETKSILSKSQQQRIHNFKIGFSKRFPVLYTALPRLPFALVPFAFSQFMLIEALAHQGWIEIFAQWLIKASNNKQMYPTIWLIGVLGVILCNLAGTNIGATILLTKVVRAADMPHHVARAAAIALAVSSNIGAVSFTFSASLAGLLWKGILEQKGIKIKQFDEFARWNTLPLVLMTAVGLGVVCAEMAVLYKGMN